MTKIVKVHVLYCGGWGYGSKADSLGAQISNEYGEEVDFSTESTPGISGFFEVTVNGQRIHSKNNGDGFVDSESKLQKIFSSIDKQLEK